MNTVLTWTNQNTGSFTTNIYRGTAPLDLSNLTNPVATLTAGESTWTDTNTVRDTLYYYVFETVVGADKEHTNNIPIRAVPRKGPGPANITIGDYTYGYYGTLTSGEFINASDLRSAVGLTAGAVVQQGPLWHKWARNGKILYIPNGPLSNGAGWKQLYDLGLVFGVDGPGPYNAGANVNQSAKVTIGNEQFRVRLMTGFSDNYNQFPVTPGVSGEPPETFLNEWNDLVYPLSMWTPDLQRMSNIQQSTAADLGMTLTGVTSGHVIQERISATASSNAMTRGNSGNTRSGIASRASIVQTGAAYGWWPVLELM